MSRELNFPFEELPLVIDLGFEAGLVNGSALISYWTDGQWGISQVYLEGHRDRGAKIAPVVAQALFGSIPNFPRFEKRDVLLDRGSPINLMIQDRLEHDWHSKVQEAVNAALEDERVAEHA